jgi:hypothetical protein
MTVHEHDRNLEAVPAAVYGVVGAGAVALILAFAAFAATRPAVALPAYAQQTGLACGRCHVNPAGGGPRNAFGNAFAANGHKVASTKEPGKNTAKEPGKNTASGGASSSAPPAPSTPSIGAGSPSDSDYAQAQAWSLRQPYYSHFLYMEK